MIAAYIKAGAVIYDLNGREASDVQPVVKAAPDVEQYIFCSSAGVYLKSDQMPHREEDATDPKSRHKVCTASMLQSAGAVVRYCGLICGSFFFAVGF